MSELDYADWLASVRQKASRHVVLFLQLGVVHEPARRALGAEDFGRIGLDDYLTCDLEPQRAIIVIDEVERLITQSRDRSMGILRERVFRHVDLGVKFVLLSRAPRAAFPTVPGSSLLDDAIFVRGPHVPIADAAQWPACALDGQDPETVLRKALVELGAELCASLDRVLYEDQLVGEDALRQLSARELEALDGAGITTYDDATGRRWSFPGHLGPVKKHLAHVIADQVAPPQQLAPVSEAMWSIERLIRRAVRARAEAVWGDSWRSQCLNGDLPAKVLDRATESAYPGAVSLKQLRDPLEWLSLGELLQIKERREIGDLGLKSVVWRQFSTQVIPIRNRLAHMRTLHPGDSAVVVKWQRLLEQRLSA